MRRALRLAPATYALFLGLNAAAADMRPQAPDIASRRHVPTAGSCTAGPFGWSGSVQASDAQYGP